MSCTVDQLGYSLASVHIVPVFFENERRRGAQGGLGDSEDSEYAAEKILRIFEHPTIMTDSPDPAQFNTIKITDLDGNTEPLKFEIEYIRFLPAHKYPTMEIKFRKKISVNKVDGENISEGGSADQNQNEEQVVNVFRVWRERSIFEFECQGRQDDNDDVKFKMKFRAKYMAKNDSRYYGVLQDSIYEAPEDDGIWFQEFFDGATEL